MKLKTVWILYRSFRPKWNFKLAWDFHVNIIYPKRNGQAQIRWMLRLMHMCVWNSMRVWISYWSFWEKRNFISGHKNAWTCPLKHRVVLKCSFMWTEIVFTLVWNLKPVGVHFASYVNVLSVFDTSGCLKHVVNFKQGLIGQFYYMTRAFRTSLQSNFI